MIYFKTIVILSPDIGQSTRKGRQKWHILTVYLRPPAEGSQGRRDCEVLLDAPRRLALTRTVDIAGYFLSMEH